MDNVIRPWPYPKPWFDHAVETTVTEWRDYVRHRVERSGLVPATAHRIRDAIESDIQHFAEHFSECWPAVPYEDHLRAAADYVLGVKETG
jgi:hypothetical protein